MSEIQVYPGAAELARAAARHILEICSQSIEQRGRCNLALAGGSTPASIFAVLRRKPYRSLLDWQQVHFFWGDERMVPPDHPLSNYRQSWTQLLSYLPIPPENIHRMPGELEPAAAAEQYEGELRSCFNLVGVSPPVFDLILLGMGPDGHVASLFPGSPALGEQQRWVLAVEHDQPPEPLVPRLTLTLPVLNAARCVTLVVSGQGKAESVGQILGSAGEPPLLPAAMLRPARGRLVWMLDAQAASALAVS